MDLEFALKGFDKHRFRNYDVNRQDEDNTQHSNNSLQ
jgi:hypothetical protein